MNAVVGKGKTVHVVNERTMETGCGRSAIGARETETDATCKVCAKSNVGVMRNAVSYVAPTLFETVTEVPTESVVEQETETEIEYHPTMAYVAAAIVPTVETVETETDVEQETETGPSDAEIFRMMASDEIAETVLTGYTAAEWVDVMLSTDTHNVDMSRGIAVERLFMTKQAARKAKRDAAEIARVERGERLARAASNAETARQGDAYGAMTWIMSALRTRGVVMTLAADAETVRVESVSWVKGEGDTLETVATFTVRHDGMLEISTTGGVAHTVTIVGAIALFTELLPERSKDLMPRKYRDVMRTHRHKNASPTDKVGNRAAREIDGVETASLTAEDLTAYAATLESRAADVAGVKTSGKRSMQGVKLTESERRESDRARQAAYRAAKRARAIAESMTSFVSA